MASATEATSTVRYPSINGSPAGCALDHSTNDSVAITNAERGNTSLVFIFDLGAIIAWTARRRLLHCPNRLRKNALRNIVALSYPCLSAFIGGQVTFFPQPAKTISEATHCR